jgi:hypothetical protein
MKINRKGRQERKVFFFAPFAAWREFIFTSVYFHISCHAYGTNKNEND